MGVRLKVEYECEICGKHKLDIPDSEELESSVIDISLPQGWLRLDDRIMCEDCADAMAHVCTTIIQRRIAGDKAFIDLWDTMTKMVADDDE